MKSQNTIVIFYLAFVCMGSLLLYATVGAWPYVLGKPYLSSQDSQKLYQQLQNPTQLKQNIEQFAQQQPESAKIQRLLQAALMPRS